MEAAMGERSDGRWASKFIGLSAPRQNGKSQLIMARALAGVLLFGEKTIIVSAHQTDTAREIFQRMLDVVESNPSVESRVSHVMKAINRESITFGKGAEAQTIKIKARSASGSRGFSADCLLLDEAQILGKQAWGSIVPTMSARPNPQMWLFGTPPTVTDDPFAFSRVRQSAQEKKARHTWLEWAAAPDDDFDDPAVWAKANPSFGVRISEEACADDRAAMDDQQFGMERLGIWEDISARGGVIPFDAWRDRLDEDSFPAGRYALGVEASPDLASAAVSLAGQRDDEAWHVELVEHRTGGAWLDAYVAKLVEANPEIRSVVVDVGGPVGALLEEYQTGKWRFRGSKTRVMPMKVKEIGTACTRLLDGTVTGWLHHIGQPQMDAAVLAAAKRDLSDTGLWTYSRKNSTSDITPIQSATWALHGAQEEKVRRPAVKRSEGTRRAVILT